jgi:hypothetical protein
MPFLMRPSHWLSWSRMRRVPGSFTDVSSAIKSERSRVVVCTRRNKPNFNEHGQPHLAARPREEPFTGAPSIVREYLRISKSLFFFFFFQLSPECTTVDRDSRPLAEVQRFTRDWSSHRPPIRIRRLFFLDPRSSTTTLTPCPGLSCLPASSAATGTRTRTAFCMNGDELAHCTPRPGDGLRFKESLCDFDC